MRNMFERIRESWLGGVFLAIAVVIGLGCVYAACSNSLHRTCFISGWALFAALTVAFTRRFLTIRAGKRPELWVGQQVVLAVAIVTLFLMHVEFTRPNGWLDSVLAGLFLVVVGTGSAGVVLWARLRAGTIAATGAAPGDAMDAERRDLLRRAEVALGALGASVPEETIGRLRASFASGARPWRRLLLGSDLSSVLAVIRTLEPQAGGAAGTLSALAIEKDRLDAQRAGDLAVRRWLLVHMPCVACLIALGSMHGVIAHAHGLLAHVMLGK